MKNFIDKNCKKQQEKQQEQQRQKQKTIGFAITCMLIGIMIISSGCGIVGRTTADATDTTITVSAKTAKTGTPIKEPIKIGALLMLTGDLAMIGEEIQRGIDIAVDEINKKGGIHGRKIKMIYEDSGLINKEKIVSAAHKLIFQDKVDAVLIDTVNAIKPIAPLFEENKIPIIVLWDNTKFLEGTSDYVLGIGFSTEKTGEKMADFAYDTLHLRNVAIIAHFDEWAEIISQSFKDRFKERGGSIVLHEKVEIPESDFRTIITKIQNKETDGIYLAFIPQNVDVFLKQAKEQGLEIPILGGDTFTEDVIAASGNAAEGVYFTNIYTDYNSLLDTLQEKYKSSYKEAPHILAFTSFGYDGVRLLHQAMVQTKQITPITIKNELHHINNFSLSGGGTISITEKGPTLRIEKIFQVRKGQAVLVEN